MILRERSTIFVVTALSCLLFGQNPGLAEQHSGECVVLLHGLARTNRSMTKMADRLAAAGFDTVNLDYPSRRHPLNELAEMVVPQGTAACQEKGATAVHFVTHSLGGILVRYYLKYHILPQLGRVVMLAPPNHGSRMVDAVGNTWLFKLIYGPAASQLTTDNTSILENLGRVDFNLGVIAGDCSINPLFSAFIEGDDDGQLSPASTEIEGMQESIVVHASHAFIMRNSKAIAQTLFFLEHGKFNRDAE
jgi:triacylglycerol lipase